MTRQEKPEKTYRSFIMPNESFKWDFVLALLDDEDLARETVHKRKSPERSDALA